MTTLLSPITTFTTPVSETFANISRATINYFEKRAQKSRLAHDMKLLQTMDTHMLKDIGLTGFNRLAQAEQESLLLETLKDCLRN
jgi:uncharacterized protein YjiS (DUF1127 family)